MAQHLKRTMRARRRSALANLQQLRLQQLGVAQRFLELTHFRLRFVSTPFELRRASLGILCTRLPVAQRWLPRLLLVSKGFELWCRCLVQLFGPRNQWMIFAVFPGIQNSNHL